MRYYPDLSKLQAWSSRLSRPTKYSRTVPAPSTQPQTAQPAAHVPPMHSLDQEDPRNIMLLGPYDGALMKPSIWLEGQSVHLDWESSFAKARALLSRRTKYSHLLIDLDALGGIAKLFDTLRRFRDEMPTIPVILFSSDFLVDDMDLDRIWLCDASLRPTATFTTLELALAISEVNNQHWQAQFPRLASQRAAQGG